MKNRARTALAFLAPVLLMIFPQGLLSQWKNAPQKKILENGLTVISQKDEASSVTVLEILIKGGKKAEPAGREGLSYLTTRLALEIPDQSKAIEFMEKSSRYMMTTKGDYSVIHIECLSEFLENTLGVFIQILEDPLFTGIRIDRIKEYMSNQRKIEGDDNINVGHLAQLRTFLGNLGYGGSITGEEESLKKLKARDIEAFYKNYFWAGNMILVAVSDLDGEKLFGILEKHFGSFPSKKPAELSPLLSSDKSPLDEKETVIEKDTKQALVSIAFALPKISPKNQALAVLLENLLGKGPGSRLWTLRTEEKLAYNVNAQTTIMKEGGILEAYLESDGTKCEAAKEALKNIIQELYEKGISSDEVQEAKTLVKSNFLRANETKDKRTGTFGQFEALGLGFDYFAKFFGEVDAVTLDEINSYMKEVLNPEKSALVIVGPKNK
jgi:predicted Zn-dependent peptidase